MINAAVVGLGWWGRVMTDAVQRKSDKITIVAGATRTKSKAVDFAKQQGFRLLDSYEDVLADPEVDAVILTTPHSQHADQVIAAAQAGKHVFVEKPFTLTRDSSERAIAAVESAGVTIGLGYLRRYHPALAELRDRLARQTLGTVLHFEAVMNVPAGPYLSPDAWRSDPRESPAGSLMSVGSHAIDNVIDLLGEVDEVFCQSVRRREGSGIDDTTSALLRMKSGVTGYLGTNFATAQSFRLSIFGTDGSAEITDGALRRIEFRPVQGHSSIPGEKGEAKGPETVEFPDVNLEHAELEAFADAIDGGPAYAITHQEMIHGSAVLEAIARSAQSHQVEKVT